MVTVRQLTYFSAVVTEGSFTEAASVLGISQPGLSHQIHALETGLGGRLLDRSARGVRLTPMGRAVLPHARATVADAARVADTAAAVLAGAGGSIEVATIHSLSLGVLPGVLRTFRSRHPEVTVGVQEFPTVDALLACLESGQADVAVTPLPDDWPGVCHDVGVEEFVIVVARDHRLARRGRTTAPVEEFADDAWVQFSAGHGLAGVLEHVAGERGFVPRVAMRTGQTAAAPSYAAAGIGPALVPANMVPPHFSGHVLRPDPPITRKVFVIGREPMDPVSANFTATVLDSARLMPRRLRSHRR